MLDIMDDVSDMYKCGNYPAKFNVNMKWCNHLCKICGLRDTGIYERRISNIKHKH